MRSKKTDIKGNILYASAHMAVCRGKTIMTKESLRVAWRWEEENDYKKAPRN